MNTRSSPLTPLLVLGEALSISGAETYRTEEAIERAAQGFGCTDVHAMVTPSGLSLSINWQGVVETGVRRVRSHQLDLSRLVSLNALARASERGSLLPTECEQAVVLLMRQRTSYPAWVELLAGAAASGSYAWFIGASLADASFAALGGMLTILLRRRPATHFAERFFNLAAGGFAVGLVGAVAALRWHESAAIVTAAGVVVLVPGLAVTSALRDLLAGDVLSAGASGLDALASALAIASGTALALAIGYGAGVRL